MIVRPYPARMPHLVAIDLPGGLPFVDAVRRAWDRGDAVMPIDRRLPAAARSALLEAMNPTHLVDAEGERPLEGGRGVEPGDAVVMATSGSTGTPKGVVLTHTAMAASARATAARLDVGPTDRWLACLPLAHIGGFSVITKALVNDTPLTVLPGFDVAAVEEAARDGATLVSLVATALQRIDPSLFRMIVLGGSRPPADRPSNCIATYGMTETGSGVVYDGLPLDGVELRIATDGEVLVRGPMVLRCYRDGTTPVDDEGWLHTDDAGRIVDGRLQVDGRRGDLIVTGGENVWPDTVERALQAHPSVAEVAVAGVADAEWGQRVVAWVVPVAGAPLALADLRAFAAESLPAFMAPKELVVVPSIPRTALGKVARGALSRAHSA